MTMRSPTSMRLDSQRARPSRRLPGERAFSASTPSPIWRASRSCAAAEPQHRGSSPEVRWHVLATPAQCATAALGL